MAYRDDTGGETMGNKGGTTLHSFLHKKRPVSKFRIWA